MTSDERDRRPGPGARRFGYTVAVCVNVAILYVLNAEPGWRDLPVLTDATGEVIGLVNLSLLAAVAANLVWVAADGPWVRRVGDLVTTGISMAVLIRIWQVFPFAFTSGTADWELVTRTVLAFALAGTGIALLVHTVAVARLAVRLGRPGTGTHALR